MMLDNENGELKDNEFMIMTRADVEDEKVLKKEQQFTYQISES